jgi:hypothetical protein
MSLRGVDELTEQLRTTDAGVTKEPVDAKGLHPVPRYRFMVGT